MLLSLMIDIHCHLLPDIDDGPTSLKLSLDMARHAVASGIKRAVVTPHIHPGRYENCLHTISPIFESFRRALENNDINLELGMAAEVRICPEIVVMVEDERIPYLGELDGAKILLLEMPHSHIPPGSENLVQWLLDNGIRPMIAHPERNKDVIRDIESIAPFVELGCLLQITSASVVGGFGPQCKERSMQLLERGWVSVMASDAHNLKCRPPELTPGLIAAAEKIGDEAAWLMVSDTPMSIVGQQFNTSISQ